MFFYGLNREGAQSIKATMAEEQEHEKMVSETTKERGKQHEE